MTEEEKILQEARENFQLDSENMAEIYAAMEEDLQFVNGEQWPDSIKSDRMNENRPCLTINRLLAFVNQVANEQRQNRPRIKVKPFDNSTDKATSDVVSGLLYHIQNRSDAEVAFDTADEFAIEGGIGYFRITTDYVDDENFEQEILIKRIDNPFSVLFPIHLCSEPDWSDARHCFVINKLDRKEYERLYDDNPSNWESNYDSQWITKDEVTVCEYFKVEETEKTLYLYETAEGQIKTYEKIEGLEPLNKRQVTERKVMWHLLSANKILEQKEWQSKWIPIIPVLGKEMNIKGKKSYISLTRFAKDPQRNYNYLISAQTERIALAPLAPFVGYTGQFKDPSWGLANRKTIPYLEAEPLTIAGTLAPLPRRQDPVQGDTGLIELRREASEDVKATTGMFDASIGNEGSERSGRAIIARQRQGDKATFHFIDNLTRAMRHAGRIIVDLIPKIIDTPRAIRILGEDMTEKVVMVNQAYFDKEQNKEVLYDVTAGRFDVVVDVGPAYTSKREEAAQMLSDLIQASPPIAQATSDLLAKFLELPDEIVERLKKTLPPGLLDTGKGDGMSEDEIRQIVGDMQKLMAEKQMTQQVMQQMQTVIAQLQGELKSKQADNQAKIEVAQINGEAKVASEVIKAKNNKDITGMKISADQAMKIAAAIQNIVSGGGAPGNASMNSSDVAQTAMNQ